MPATSPLGMATLWILSCLTLSRSSWILTSIRYCGVWLQWFPGTGRFFFVVFSADFFSSVRCCRRFRWTVSPITYGYVLAFGFVYFDASLFRRVRMCFPGAIEFSLTVSSGYALLADWTYRIFYMFRGSRTCFPGCVEIRRLESYAVCLPFCVQVPRSLFLPGRQDGFSRARHSVSSRFPCPRCSSLRFMELDHQ